MHVIKTTVEKSQYHLGKDMIRDFDINIGARESDSQVAAKLNKGLPKDSDGKESNFKLWANKTIPGDLNKIRYENFVLGYFYRHDLLPNEPRHSVYFRWDGDQVRVFVSPLLVQLEPVAIPETAPIESLIGDAAADTTDPPPSTTPPPPLQGGNGKR